MNYVDVEMFYTQNDKMSVNWGVGSPFEHCIQEAHANNEQGKELQMYCKSREGVSDEADKCHWSWLVDKSLTENVREAMSMLVDSQSQRRMTIII